MLRLMLSALVLTFCVGGAFAQNHTQIGRVSRTQAADRGGFNADLKPFYHGVASGDPTSSSVVIWTRVTPENNETTIPGSWFVATDTAFANIVATGTFSAEQAQDYTVKIDVSGLAPGTTYYYYFRVQNAASLIGRAKTTPTNTDHLKFAVISCSNYEGGYFNAYGRIADRNDIDAVLHLGDYIYEYGAGTYGIQLPGRINEPATEILSLADYRTRYSLYRLDPDLIRAHQQHTFITIWDDHESANDSYVDGAQNHQPDEGPWEVRKNISKQVYFEWMPVRNTVGQSVYRSISYGNLCDLFMLDTRLEGRVQPPPSFDTPDVPARTIISPVQFEWLTSGLKNSTAQWKVLGNQVLFSNTNVGFAAGLSLANIDSVRFYENQFIDNWESYPTQRNSIIDTLRINNIDNVVIVTGDSHSSWAFDVTASPVNYPNPVVPTPNPFNPATGAGYTPTTGEGSWAVEFGTPSVSSPNFDEALGAALTAQFEVLVNNPIPIFNAVYNPHLKYVDLDRHGYFLLDLTSDKAQADFYYVGSLTTIDTTESFGAGSFTANNANHLTTATTPAAPKTVQDIPAPSNPPLVSSTFQPGSSAAIFSVYPNPAQSEVLCQVGFDRAATAAVNLYDETGRLVTELQPALSFEPGIYNLVLPVEQVPNGVYFLRVEGKEVQAVSRIVVKR